MDNTPTPPVITSMHEYWRIKSLEYYYRKKDIINAKRRAKYNAKYESTTTNTNNNIIETIV